MIVSAAKASQAAEVLGVSLDGLTPKALADAYRAKAKECHPDKHGTAKLQQWSSISWANDCLKFWVAAHPAEEQSESSEIALRGGCLVCKGSGRVNVRRRGFGPPLTMECVTCRGEGSVTPMEDDHD